MSTKHLDALRDAPSYSLHLDAATGLYEVSTPDEPGCKFFVDRDHGYLVKRVEYRDDSDTLIRVCAVDFRNTDGRWWPAEQRIDAYLDDALQPDSVRKITSVTLNPSIADDQFQIEFPKDARIMPAEVSTLEIAQTLSESGLGMPPEGYDSVNTELETIPEHAESKPGVAERITVPKLPRARHATEPAQPPPAPEFAGPIWIGAGIFVIVAGAGAYWRFRRKRR